ncbi:acyl-CoA dehydrogenase [Clostridium homopropionicum DSM 5847]|uniref:Acyl-CoA dehydrogenase n=1 Tax=Clostridium homopropionicum DSM 5847 TaxID=1121318 RepID=A0A0L6Z5M9_9CLOT|nr:acyl-CoA dehydrogenase [Clostridium homopropionicum]KOA18274.1 acyl-CoA dehydrogenase [Clostridium homopropionicum DSM 5847]SFF70038.1 butyryl-CoA dehydrogenase [Clostridium homopropionicum]
MDFSFTREHELVKQLMKQFVDNEVRPIAAEIDETERFPLETIEKMAKYGIKGMSFSSQYGGSNTDYISYVIAVEELAKACCSTACIYAVSTGLVAAMIEKFGNEQQKQKYLPGLLAGTSIGAFALTEANAGSDASAQQTVAKDMGDYYLLNGSKTFITNAGYSSVYIVMAMTDKSKGVKGISAFLVEKDMEGFSIGKIEEKCGVRASSTGELIFEDVKVPKENLLGKEGKGFNIAMAGLDGGRISIATQALGLAEGALDEAIKYVKERKQFGKPIGKNQGLQWYIAECATKIEAGRALLYKAAWLKQAGLPYGKEAAMAKFYNSELAMEVTIKALQMHGGYGYTKDYAIERMFRDAKITSIYEGTSEVQKIVISRHILDL